MLWATLAVQHPIFLSASTSCSIAGSIHRCSSAICCRLHSSTLCTRGRGYYSTTGSGRPPTRWTDRGANALYFIRIEDNRCDHIHKWWSYSLHDHDRTVAFILYHPIPPKYFIRTSSIPSTSNKVPLLCLNYSECSVMKMLLESCSAYMQSALIPRYSHTCYFLYILNQDLSKIYHSGQDDTNFNLFRMLYAGEGTGSEQSACFGR